MPVHPVVDTLPVVYDPDDPTKQIRLDAGALGSGQTRVLALPDRDVDLGDVLSLGAGKGLVSRDRFGNFTYRRIVAASMMVYISQGDGESANPSIDVVPGNIDHADLGGLTTDPNPHGSALDDQSDVNAAAPTDDEVLTWDSGTNRWINQAIPAKLREFALSPYYIEDPQAGDEFSIAKVANAADIIRVGYIRKGGTAISFNMYIKNEDSPESTGTKVWSSDKTAGITYTATTSFTAKDIAQYQVLFVKVVTVTGSVDWLRVEPIIRLD